MSETLDFALLMDFKLRAELAEQRLADLKDALADMRRQRDDIARQRDNFKIVGQQLVALAKKEGAM